MSLEMNGALFFFCSFTSQSRGVAIFFGNFLALVLSIEIQRLSLITIHGPNDNCY